MGVATGYGLDGRRAGIRVPVEVTFYLLYVEQTGSVAHPSCYAKGTLGFFTDIKRPRREADHLPSTNSKVKNTLIYK
jgi:hypothetical protein